VIYIGTSGVTRPHTFRDESGHLTGYDIEVARLLEKHMDGYRFEFIIVPFSELFLGIDSGRFDMVVNNLGRNAEREASYLFGERGYVYTESLLVVRGDDPRTRIEEFQGGVMGALPPGNWFTNLLIQANETLDNPFTIEYYEDYNLMSIDIDNGRLDGTLNSAVIVAWTARALGLNLKTVGEPFTQGPSYWITRRDAGGEALKAKLDAAMEIIVADGSLLALSMEWFGADWTRPRSDY
jgi:L-cystine transport system substrate-binding protein